MKNAMAKFHSVIKKYNVMEIAKDVIILSVMVTLISYYYAYAMFRIKLLPGIDGPYYAVQVNHIMKYGILKYPDPPLTFYLMALFNCLIHDTFSAVKICTCTLTALSIVPLYFLILKITKSRIASILSTILFSLNFQMFRLLGDFMKNSIGLLWLNLFIYLSLKFFMDQEDLRKKSSIVLLILALFLALLTHILDFYLAIFYGLVMGLILTFQRDSELRRKGRTYLTVLLIILTISFIIPQASGYDVLKISSFIRDISIQKASSPRPLKFLPLDFTIMTLLYVLAAISLSIIYYVRKDVIKYTFMITNTIILSFLSNPLLPAAWFFRLSLMTHIPISIIVATLVGELSKDHLSQIAITFIILAYPLSSISNLPNILRPSIPLGEYYELKQVISKFDGENVRWIVPDVRLRYWTEVFTENVLIPMHPPPRQKSIVMLLLIEKKSRIPPPKFATIVFEGLFLRVYKLERRPPPPRFRPKT